MNESPKEILDTMLGYLGFFVEIHEQFRGNQPILQVITNEPRLLIGKHEQTLDDLQFLLNRILQAQDPNAPRVIVDVDHHKAMRDEALLQKVRALADSVRATGKPAHTEPLNSYDRYIVHNEFLNDPDLISVSPKDQARLKRITIRRRTPNDPPPSPPSPTSSNPPPPDEPH